MTEHEPPMTEDEEKLRMEAERRERESAERILSAPVGGIKPTKFRVQLTGGDVELPPSKAAHFPKDGEVEILVAGIPLRGWIKTDKTTTEKKGSEACRVAVVVIEVPDTGDQLRLDGDE